MNKKVDLWWGVRQVDPDIDKIRRKKLAQVKRMLDRHAIKESDYKRWLSWSLEQAKDWSYDGTEESREAYEATIDYENGEYPFRDYEGKSCMVKRMDYCIRCQRPMQQIHHVFGGPRRKIADEDGFVIPLCAECHRLIHANRDFSDAWKTACQEHFELHMGDHEDWMARYGKNYLDVDQEMYIRKQKEKQCHDNNKTISKIK